VSQELIFQTVRDLKTEVALHSEPQKVGKVGGLWIYSCYSSRLRNNIAVRGDFDSWALEWTFPRTTPRGRSILETSATLDVALLKGGNQHMSNRARSRISEK